MGFFDKLFQQNKNTDKSNSLNWETLDSLEGLDSILEASKQAPVAIFKHSTRCSISSMAKERLERQWDFEEGQAPTIYYLDLIAFRPVSNEIAARLGVEHQSPQLLLVKEGKVLYHASHNSISVAEMRLAMND